MPEAFFLSYASVERLQAESTKAALESRGRSVWIDQLDEDSIQARQRFADTPRGQAHWGVIERAIDESTTFLVLASASWLASTYCAEELAHARAVGKRIAVITALDVTPTGDLAAAFSVDRDDLAQLIDQLKPGDTIAEAHARLLARLREGERTGWRTWLPWQDRAARDAQLLIEAPVTKFGVGGDAHLLALCRRLLRTARRRRRALTSAASAIIVALGALAGVTLVSRHTAEVGRAAAAAAAAHALSLLTSQRAQTAPSTAQALALAQQAVRLQDNPATRATLAKIQSVASYRMTQAVPQGVSRGVSVSDDGHTVLDAQLSSVLVLHPDTGSSSTVAIPAGAGNRVALTPDGTRGYLLDAKHRIVCLSTVTNRLTMSPVTDATDLKVDMHGTLWWLTADGKLLRSSGCPDSTSNTVVASDLGSAVAFDVVDSPPEVFTLTSANVVNAYSITAAGGPESFQLLASTSLTSIHDDSAIPLAATPDSREVPFVIHCGSTIHVLAGVRWSLNASTHAGFDLAGHPIGPRTSNIEMNGLGCGPGTTAWADPLITPQAVALPSTGYFPIGEIDSRDSSSDTVIANSPDSTRTVVAHTDGRVDVLTVARTPWGTTAGSALTAAPIAGGTITIDEHGIARFYTGDTSVPIGDVGGTPASESIAFADRAYFAVGSKVVEVDRHTIRQAFDTPGPISTLASSSAGDEIIAGGQGWWLASSTSGNSAPQQLTMPTLATGDRVSSVQGDGTDLLETTEYGRLLLATPTGHVVASTDVGVAGGLVASVLSDNAVAAMGADGLLRLYSTSLILRKAVLFGFGAISMRASANGHVLVIGLNDFSVWAVSALTLQAESKLETRSPNVLLVIPAPDGRSVTALLPNTGAGGTSLLETMSEGD